ncbi:MAG: hypothetical protein P8K73_06530 [Methylophilaceae bacterium]|nr:hypothetical protein [Methylophilaceae bacterium]
MSIRTREIASEVMALIQGNEKDRNQGFVMYGHYYGPKFGIKESDFNPGEFTKFGMTQGLSYDEASEVYQLTTIKIFKKAGTLEELKYSRTWMYQILRNTLLDYKKKQKTDKKHIDYSLDEIEISCDSPSTAIKEHEYKLKDEYQNQSDCVQDKLDKFYHAYPEHAAALDYQMDGMDIKSIADVIGRSAIATKEFLSQARKKITPTMEECLQIGEK